MSFLLDTNVVSELRKDKRASRKVTGWMRRHRGASMYLSVLTVGELRRGVELTRHRGDSAAASRLDAWLEALESTYANHLLSVDQEVADTWGRLDVSDPLASVDGLLAATARVHGLTLATRNVRDIARTGVACVNPFEG